MRRAALAAAGAALLGLAVAACVHEVGDPRPAEADGFADGIDVRLHWHARGRGPDTLIIASGGPGFSSETVAPLEQLAGGSRRVIRFDPRGTGRSGRPADGGYRLEDYVDDLESVRIAAGAPRVDLLGQSFGGLVVLAYASAHPDRVRDLVLVGSAPPFASSLARGQQRFEERLEALAKRGITPAAIPGGPDDDCRAAFASIQPAYFADPSDPAASEDEGATCSRSVATASWQQLPSDGYDLRPKLAALDRPVLVIQGRSDPFGTEWADDVVSSLPHARAREILLDRCGHHPWHEEGSCPSEFFADVEAFLR